MSTTKVLVAQGEIQGKLEKFGDSTFVSFKGIPYAKPPLGNLRFTAPQPPEKWTGILDATEHRDVCLQKSIFVADAIEGSEDCLYLNVYTPKVVRKDNEKYPVMLFIHGGAFRNGSGNSDLLGPEYLVNECVVLVTINYRLEVFGFISLDTKDVPGNAGLKDQVAAMKWVRDNISKFGGDTNNVTLFGESAGSSSVAYHLTSPLSKGLFHAAIAQSGVSTSNWAPGLDPVNKAFSLGKTLGKETTDKKELIKFLRRVPAEDLLKAAAKEHGNNLGPHYYPVVEKVIIPNSSFMTSDIGDLLSGGLINDVPLVIGYNSGEGIIEIKEVLKKLNEINSNMYAFLKGLTSQKLSNGFTEKIKKFYFDDQPLSENNVKSIVNLRTDLMFALPIQTFAKKYAAAAASPVHFYYFDCRSERNNLAAFWGSPEMSLPCHGDELFYMFRTNLFNVKDVDFTSSAGIMMSRVLKLWTNVAKFGNPTPAFDRLVDVKWEPILDNQFNCLYISDTLKMIIDPDKTRLEFLKDMYVNNEIHSNACVIL